MHFSCLRLQGFKSFVDPTDLLIQDGLTGIVGPNGCGKSNLVEALRWVMGETSPKRMRGAGMEDVIFAGTATRPARNLAEVSLTLDNTDRTAGAAYNDSDDLFVTRRIERDSGSDYRINGRPVRQRDVQLLFADQATGAQATSVVGQGQIDALIRARPQDRRQVLEEASGTAGLQARRHEAELKLKAAESNLTRVDDVIVTLDAQLRALKQQVRQASRYRNLAAHIRRTKAALMHLRWLDTEKQELKTRESLVEAQNLVGACMALVAKSEAARVDIAARLPALRKDEAVAAAGLQKLTLARAQIDQESARLESQLKATQTQLDQAKDDQTREQTYQSDSLAAISRLQEEKERIRQEREKLEASLPATLAALETASQDVQSRDQALTGLLQEAAQAEAQRQALLREKEDLAARAGALDSRQSDLESQKQALDLEMVARADLFLAASMVEACEKELERRKQQVEQTSAARRESQDTQNAARERWQQVHAQQTRHMADIDALEAFLALESKEQDQVIDLISVAPGLEKALAVALGESLTASLNPADAMHWRDVQNSSRLPSLPSIATPLSSFVNAPASLARALAQVGLVENNAQGQQAAAQLQCGQILVSRDGWAWRWDGFTLTPEAKTAAATRLEGRNRLASLREKQSEGQKSLDQAHQDLESANALFAQCQDLENQTREQLQVAFTALNDARDHHAGQKRENEAAHARLSALHENLKQNAQDQESLATRKQVIEKDLSSLADQEALQQRITAQRNILETSRGEKAAHQSAFDHLNREKDFQDKRLTSIEEDLQAWHNRASQAEKAALAFITRIKALEQSFSELQAKPEALAAQRQELLTQLSEAENLRSRAADILIAAEHELEMVERQLKEEEAKLAAARENRIRTESAASAVAEQFSALRERIREKLDCEPQDVRALADFDEAQAMPSAVELEQLLARYSRERDNMGPVNLRAEVEAEATQTEMEKLTREKEDLVAAIKKLRLGIGQLNREARDRLNHAFEQVNERFQKLFTKLFGGGKASLALVENEDPMNAGLEIFAAPPGKKQQILSLLSGGEKTLTALALLFAVFQTNPSPICVLDEAEASLDESNIDRFCALVQEIGLETSTRFLIITHQRLTMAHMDRLYGVTMSEKGVSQLVSVDLAGAVALRDGEKRETALDTAEQALEAVQAA
ncbi:MAG: chromosome segregation protein SMC [Alphaproteobacteria bacterium]|nr:chromosome segregation protein SMC [Alphaproteobacteria bacterium]